MNDAGLEKRIGLVIRTLRELNELTQTDLAERAGISQPAVSLVEKGERSNLMTLDAIARAMESKLSGVIAFAERAGESAGYRGAEGLALMMREESAKYGADAPARDHHTS